MLHLHDLDHVEVRLGGGLVDSENGIDDIGREALGQAGAEFCGKGGSGDGEEELAVDFAGELELIEELRESANVQGHSKGNANLERLVLRNLEPVCDDARVQTLLDIAIRLLQQLTDEQHHRCCTIAANVVLRRRGPSNHDRGGVLYLHLTEEDIAILRQFDLWECQRTTVVQFPAYRPIRT